MIALFMAVSLIGSVVLVGAYGPLVPASSPAPPVAYFSELDAGPTVNEKFDVEFSISGRNFFYIEREYEMKSDTIKDQMRRGIVERSIEVLRRHGKNDEEIRSIILSDFHIDEDTVTEILTENDG